MKKFLYVLIAIAIVLTMSFACVACDDNNNGVNEYSIVAPDGATALVLASFIKDGELESGTIVPKIVASNLIASSAIKSDFAVVPANVAAKLYNDNSNYKAVAVVTNGNLFIVSKTGETIETVSDLSVLSGKTIYSIGNGAVPGIILESLLTSAGIKDNVTITYCADGTGVLTQLEANPGSYGMLAEPAVTAAKSPAKGFSEVADVQELWQDATNSEVYGFAQAVLIAKNSVCENTKLIKEVIDALEANESYITSSTSEAIGYIASIYEQTALKTTLPATTIARCNVKTYPAKTNKEYLKATLTACLSIYPDKMGSKMPADAFYFGEK